MNPGSEPERDDTGLPPVDIEIPDDARELDRDVQAYYREVRAHRRRTRSSRLRGALTRDGIALPLLACCLIFALIIGTLLTVFTASGIDQGLPGSGRGASLGADVPGTSTQIGSAPSTGASAGALALHAAPQMPGGSIKVDGTSLPLQGLRPAVFLLVPVNCRCAGTLYQLTALFRGHAQTLLVATGVPASELASARRAGARVATGTARALGGYPHLGLTAIMVAANGDVQYSDGLVAGDNLNTLLQALDA